MESKDLVVGNTYIIQKGTIVSKVQILELTDKTIYHVDADDEKRKLRLLKEEFDRYYIVIEDLGNLFKKNFQEAMNSMRSDINVLIGDDVVKQVSVSMKYRMQNQFEKKGWTDFKVCKASKDTFNGIIPQMHVLDEVGQNPTLNKP